MGYNVKDVRAGLMHKTKILNRVVVDDDRCASSVNFSFNSSYVSDICLSLVKKIRFDNNFL